MRLLLAAFLFIGLVSCGDSAKKETKEDYVESFKVYEDSIKANPNALTNKKTGVEYAEKCLEIAHKFPKSDEAAEYMDKAHMIFAGLGLYARSVSLADSIIVSYPLYKNRAMVLQSAATSYDIFLLPRRKDKVKKYYEMLLKEYPKMPTEQRKDIEFRLKHIDLTFEEMVELQKTEKPA